ncbi:MAG: hypothetical protein JWN37_412 [Candidatus Nomurabacteria bacterium]|nr:hypothetical protein [Candidatus Nomurabacteria bacterium]
MSNKRSLQLSLAETWPYQLLSGLSNSMRDSKSPIMTASFAAFTQELERLRAARSADGDFSASVPRDDLAHFEGDLPRCEKFKEKFNPRFPRLKAWRITYEVPVDDPHIAEKLQTCCQGRFIRLSHIAHSSEC